MTKEIWKIYKEMSIHLRDQNTFELALTISFVEEMLNDQENQNNNV